MRASSLLLLIAVLLGVGIASLVVARGFGNRETDSVKGRYPASRVAFSPEAISERAGLPQITHVSVVDADADGERDVIVCDAVGNRVVWFNRAEDGKWREETFIEDVGVPAHATCVDVDGDQDIDCLVSVLGDIYPSDEAVGRIELFRREGDSFSREVLLEDVRRVADIQPADFDADGDIDLAVAVFGYSRGEILWLENQGDGRFADHRLHSAAGGIHVPTADFDGDGDPDIAAIISQDDEELWAFENQGGGKFEPRMLWRTPNFDLGSAGLVAADLDRDGDTDLILPTGDNLEDFAAYPQPYHGCRWFENRGDWTFTEHQIATLGGTYAAAVADLDGDDDNDIVLVSMANDWSDPANASVVWLENDGQQQFTTRQVASAPIHLVTVATGDLDGDDRPDIVAGSLNLRSPYERIGGVTAWLNRGTKP